MLIVLEKHFVNKYSYVDILTPGDLSSLHWISSKHPLSSQKQPKIVSVHYAALNFRDVMLATGKLPMDMLEEEESKFLGKLGMEFSGLDSKGSRVMGLTLAQVNVY